jgi:hypothetical protein
MTLIWLIYADFLKVLFFNSAYISKISVIGGSKKSYMYNSQLLKICKNLSKSEFKELGRFVQSPCFNQKPEVETLYDYIAEHLGNTALMPAVTFPKEKVFDILFPNQKYNDGLMRSTMHNLLKIIKLYLIQKELDQEETYAQILLARALRKRGFDDYFEKEIEVAFEKNKAQPYRNADFYLNEYKATLEKVVHISLARRKGEIPYNDLANSLEEFFKAELLRLGSATLSYKSVSKRTYQLPLLDEIIVTFEEKFKKIYSDFKKSDIEYNSNVVNTEGVASRIYFNTYQTLKTDNPLYFNDLKILLKTHWSNFSEIERSEIYIYAINFCIKKINNHESQYLSEYFDLMQAGLENRALFENGILTKFTFKNAVTAGLKLSKWEWVKNFIGTYKQHLHPKERQLVYNYNLAVYYFRTGDYTAAMPLLRYADFADVHADLDARCMLLQIYYETYAHDALSSLLDSFSAFINRQKDIGYQKDMYLNLIKCVKKIIRGDLKNDKFKQQLIIEIDGTAYLAERDWLIKKLKM